MRNFISHRVQSVPPSGIRRFFDIVATMKDVISLGIGEPDFVTPEPILKAGMASLHRGETGYTSNSGILELRQAVSRNLKRLYDVDYDPETEILITVGVSEALYLALTAILDPGDEVIVPQPCFVAYTAEVTFAGGVPVTIGTRVEDNFQVTAEAIESKITPKTKALLIGYPNNPTGAVMSRENLAQIGQLAEQYDLLVISDEIYDRLVYDGAHVCFSALPGMHPRTILLSGFSKDYAMTGWRLGYAAAPPEILAAMRKVHQYTIMSAPTTAQAAGLEALSGGEKFVQEMVAEYNRRRRLLVSGLNTLGLDCFEPKGAFYAFPSVAKSGMDENAFAEALLQEEKVAVVPGSAFGESGAGFVRMAYATAYEKIEEALNRMERFMRRHG
ncbi:MAG TPA: aminotransferase class I/II-fold pyridoxal phosphate-dependent enzyme [Anaerolineales bacterium]|nr:aminotransferase class I/II-fold pyridoxal phosphate-dependent enzyme [Anaerolineales bacterium]